MNEEETTKKIGKALTWNDLANLYNSTHPGRSAFMYKMETIFKWAETQTDKFYVNPEEGTIHKIITGE